LSPQFASTAPTRHPSRPRPRNRHDLGSLNTEPRAAHSVRNVIEYPFQRFNDVRCWPSSCRGLYSAMAPSLTSSGGVRSAAQSRHLPDLAECALRSLTIPTLFGRGTSRGCAPHPMTPQALPKRTATAPVGCSAARHRQSDQCTPAWDSRCLCHSSNEPAQQGPQHRKRRKTAGEHCGSPQYSPPAQRVVPATLTAIPGSPSSLRRIVGMLRRDHISDARQ
jgi:hypothetical protein